MDATEVIERAGGVLGVAAALGVDRTTVLKWRTRGLPILRIPEISRLANVEPHQLRPDLWPAPTDKQAAA